MPVYHKLFNNVLYRSYMTLLCCSGLVTPMFKSGGRNDPINYRRILWRGIVSNLRNCSDVRSGFELFCSILNQRLMEHVNSLNTPHNSQIGFLPNNRTADHVLTLTLIKNMSTVTKKKYTPALSTLGKRSTQFGMIRVMMGLSINC